MSRAVVIRALADLPLVFLVGWLLMIVAGGLGQSWGYWPSVGVVILVRVAYNWLSFKERA